MREDKVYRLFSFSFDILVISIAFFISKHISNLFFQKSVFQNIDWLVYFMLIILYMFFTARFKVNDYRYFENRAQVAKNAVKATIFSFAAVSFILIFLQPDLLSRSFFLLFFFLSPLLVYFSQSLTRIMYYEIRSRNNRFKKYVVMVGTDFSAREFVKDIENEELENFEIVGILTYKPSNKKKFMGYKILGDVGNLESIITHNIVDMIIVFPNQGYVDEMRETIKVCEIEGIEIFVYNQLFDLPIVDMSIVTYHGRHLVKFAASEKEPYMLMMKRFIDILGSAIFLLLFSPLFVITALAIRIEGDGPVFYSHDRSGLNGRKFKMFKFRSMINGADKLKDQLKHINEAEGPVFKAKQDPRITKVGAFIRKYSIDELPQLYNVLIGDMSLVGPRPPLPSEVKKYDRWQRRRLSMKPGLTCIWQVNGRSNVSFKKWVQMDLEYIDNWSILLDFELLLKTIPAVFTGRGAY
jgi:exopolysaccharide biosynthesis polyprenyl glycosylphosphotransferase